eukprot:3662569-Prymnesium_polylepis.2
MLSDIAWQRILCARRCAGCWSNCRVACIISWRVIGKGQANGGRRGRRVTRTEEASQNYQIRSVAAVR